MLARCKCIHIFNIEKLFYEYNTVKFGSDDDSFSVRYSYNYNRIFYMKNRRTAAMVRRLNPYGIRVSCMLWDIRHSVEWT